MKNLGKLWTGAVAYVSLLVGAGLSVAGNLADTYRVRGTLIDAVDVVLAVGPPIATLLVAELFVSEWPRRLSVQSVRWTATAVVGTLATVVSWLHINELLTARGQLTLVAVLWPIAIDGLAIMAMAKILVVRMSAGQDTDSGQDKPRDIRESAAWQAVDSVSRRVPMSSISGHAGGLDMDNPVDMGHVDTPTAGQLEDMFSLSDFLPQPSGPMSPLPVPVSSPPAPARVVRVLAPTEMDSAVAGLLSHGVPAADIKRDVAEVYGVSTKTVGRRLDPMLKALTEG